MCVSEIFVLFCLFLIHKLDQKGAVMHHNVGCQPPLNPKKKKKTTTCCYCFLPVGSYTYTTQSESVLSVEEKNKQGKNKSLAWE